MEPTASDATSTFETAFVARSLSREPVVDKLMDLIGIVAILILIMSFLGL